MSRYVVTRGSDSISRVDRDTPHFWKANESFGEGRMKKQYGDLLFDAFDEAKQHIISVAERRLARAQDFTASELQSRSTIYMDYPSREGDAE